MTWRGMRLSSTPPTTPTGRGDALGPGAYRQIPARPGDTAYTMLVLPSGPSLWRHKATPFGAVASVWAFCRFGDSLTALSRRLSLRRRLDWR